MCLFLTDAPINWPGTLGIQLQYTTNNFYYYCETKAIFVTKLTTVQCNLMECRQLELPPFELSPFLILIRQENKKPNQAPKRGKSQG